MAVSKPSTFNSKLEKVFLSFCLKKPAFFDTFFTLKSDAYLFLGYEFALRIVFFLQHVRQNFTHLDTDFTLYTNRKTDCLSNSVVR